MNTRSLTDISDTCAANASAEDASPARSASRADGRAAAAALVPLSNTGQKIGNDQPVYSDETSSGMNKIIPVRPGFELEAEWVELLTRGGKTFVVRTPLALESGVSGAALIDWLAFTVRPANDKDHIWVIDQLQRLKLIGVVEELKGGYAGYKNKAQCQGDNQRLCLIAWGGKNQAATVYVSFTGHGCARIQNWPEVRAWLEEHSATITRLDLAYDDHAGEQVSIRRAVEWYLSGGFGAGGRMPAHKLHGDWLLGDEARTGRTLEIGSRQGGKLARIYEKGKQLGDPESSWVRVEVEWHNESRRIPYEGLTNPGKFLAGSYDCLNFLDREQSRIRTDQRAAKVSFDRAIENGRHLAGKLVNLALEVYGGDYAEVVEQLRREGYPSRVEPYWHAIKEAPEILAKDDFWHVDAVSLNDASHLTRGERWAE